MADAAYDVGFIDYRVIDRMPVIERYGDRMVKSLYLACLELAFGERAEITPARSMKLHGKTLDLDEHSELAVEYPDKDELTYIPFSEFVAGPPRPELKDKIVIIGYDAERFESVDTAKGKLRPHRAFVYALVSMWASFR